MNYYIKHPKDKDKWLSIGSVYTYHSQQIIADKIKKIANDSHFSEEFRLLLKSFTHKFDYILNNKSLIVTGAGANRIDYGSSISSEQLSQLVLNCKYAKEAMSEMKKFLTFCKKHREEAHYFAKHFVGQKESYSDRLFREYEKNQDIDSLLSFIRERVFYCELPSISYTMPEDMKDWDLVEDNPGARFVQKTCYAVFTGQGQEDTGFLVNKLKMGGSISDALLFDSSLLAQRAGKKTAQQFSVIELQVSIQGVVLTEGNYKNNALDAAMSIYEKEKIEKFFEQNDIEKLKAKLAEYEAKLKEQQPKEEAKVVRRKI